MRGIFLYYSKINKSELTGIDKKVLWQIDVLRKEGLDCKLVEVPTLRRNKLEIIKNALACRLPYGNSYPTWNYIDDYNNIDFLYFRRPGAYTTHMISVLKKIKENNPRVKVIMEIPTYPYDKEMLGDVKFFPLYLKDIFNRGKLKNVLDRIAVQNKIDYIFGIKTLNFYNGINFNDVKIRTPIEDSNSINICAVASLEPWDGYERFFYGINEYYKGFGKKKITLHIAGDGKEHKNYKDLVKKLGIEESVIFYGRISGAKLDYLYNISDLALDVLGMYKKNNNVATSLKSREYLAKGLPIITGCDVDIISKDFPYYIQFENNNTIIDINKIIDFYNFIYNDEKSKKQISQEIRAYGYEVCDVKNSMNEVIEFLKD